MRNERRKSEDVQILEAGKIYGIEAVDLRRMERIRLVLKIKLKNIMQAMITLLIVLSIMLLVFYMASYLTHISMVRGEKYPYGYSNFKTFIREFSLHDKWVRDNDYPTAVFSDDFYNYYIHANIIRFNGKGMILDPISYIRFIFWSYKNRVKGNKNTVQW